MVAVSNVPYAVSIESITEFEDIHQRAQVQHGYRIYDISWDSANQRVVAHYNEQGETQWFEIRHTVPQDITLLDVLAAFGCVSDDTMPVLAFPELQSFTIENYLVTPISAEFLIQMDVVPASDNLPLDDPSPTSSDNESIEEDSDDPVIEITY